MRNQCGRERRAKRWVGICVFVATSTVWGCGRESPLPAQRSNAEPAQPGSASAMAKPDPTSEDAGESMPPTAADRAKAASAASEDNDILALIQALAKTEDPNMGLSPTMTGEGFAPIPWARRMHNGILMNHGLRDGQAFTKLVELGPKALPLLLESLGNRTPTKLTIDHSGGFGGMWYGQRPAIRWVAGEADLIRRLADQKVPDKDIVEYCGATSEFVAWAKNREPSYVTPRRVREFNPRANVAERQLLNKARREFVEWMQKGEADISDRGSPPLLDNGISGWRTRQYTVTVGDVCYVIIGQITNRTYSAVQYQPTACLYIHSPTHDPQIADDLRSVWTSDVPEEMLYASLLADFEDSGEGSDSKPGAALRLGYYYPQRSEKQLLELLAQLVAANDKESDYKQTELLEAIMASRSQKVQERLLKLLETTTNDRNFLVLQRAFGPEHDILVRQRMLGWIEAFPESGDVWDGDSLLRALIERFPSDARPLCKQFIESPSLRRKDIVINVLWNHPWAPELLPPLLEDQRPFGHYSEGDRVCDRAAQAISNNLPDQSFDSDSPVASRDEQIHKIKLQCLGIGVRKTSSD
jgi:hypothetical protein